MKSLLLICLVSLFCVAPQTRAEDAPKAQSGEMKKLIGLVGKWTLHEIDAESPFLPAGKVTFKTTTRFIYNGHFLEEKGSGKIGNRVVAYTTLTHYDADAKKYRTISYDNAGGVSTGEGVIESKTFNARSTTPLNGKIYQIKSESTLSEDGKAITYEWVYSEDGQNWKPMLKGTGTKTGR